MRAGLITVGGVYHDGKLGVREVLAIDGSPMRVTYRIIAQKVEQEYKDEVRGMVSLIGTDSCCDVASFAAWAKVMVARDELENLIVELAARRLKLPRGEAEFMASVAREYAGSDFVALPGSSVSFRGDELRSARGVEKKGMGSVRESAIAGAGGEITLTALGAAWLRLKVASESSKLG